jgi:hypothetical protein
MTTTHGATPVSDHNAASTTPSNPPSACCEPEQQKTCCEPAEKAQCCGSDPQPITCGC